MAWKAVIDERHKGEKKSKGQSIAQPFVLPAAVSALQSPLITVLRGLRLLPARARPAWEDRALTEP